VKSKNRPGKWAALGEEEAINRDEDHLNLIASPTLLAGHPSHGLSMPHVGLGLLLRHMGTPVFPCIELPGEFAKAPRVPKREGGRGHKDATTDCSRSRNGGHAGHVRSSAPQYPPISSASTSTPAPVPPNNHWYGNQFVLVRTTPPRVLEIVPTAPPVTAKRKEP
jgi:hypothetical protein